MSKHNFVLFLLAPMLMIFSCAPKVIDPQTLSEKSQALLELQNCEYVYHDVIFQSQREKLLGFIMTKDTRLLFSVDLVVKAGMDLSRKTEVQRTSVRIDGHKDKLVVFIPEAKITTVDADEQSIHQYFIQEYGMFSDLRVQWLDVQEEINRSKERAKKDAIDRGILDHAWQNSASLIRNLYRLSGFQEVEVRHFAAGAAL